MIAHSRVILARCTELVEGEALLCVAAALNGEIAADDRLLGSSSPKDQLLVDYSTGVVANEEEGSACWNNAPYVALTGGRRATAGAGVDTLVKSLAEDGICVSDDAF